MEKVYYIFINDLNNGLNILLMILQFLYFLRKKIK
jgi:hypothetical protein